MSYYYQIVILSRYISLFGEIDPDIFVCYDKSCYHLSVISLKYQLSWLFVSRCELVSFNTFVLSC